MYTGENGVKSDINSDLFYDCDVDSMARYESASNYSYATSLASSFDCNSLKYEITHL